MSSEGERPGLRLRYVERPVMPGTRLVAEAAAGDEILGTEPLAAGQGFTVDVAGDEGAGKWRAVLLSWEDRPGCVALTLEIEGRYPVSSAEESAVAWLRRQVEAELGMWQALEPLPAALRSVPLCGAVLKVIDLCEDHLERDPRENGGYSEGRDDDEIERDEALADLAADVLALLADGYRDCAGWKEQWACPGCGKALREVPYGHSRAIPLDGSGTWTCSDLKSGSVSPAEFMNRG